MQNPDTEVNCLRVSYFKAEKCNDILKRYRRAKEYLCHLENMSYERLREPGELSLKKRRFRGVLGDLMMLN